MPFFAFLTVVDAFRIQIMVQQAVTCEVLPFRSENAIVAEWIDGEAASWQELAPNLDITRAKQADQVDHDLIDTVFMEVAMVSVAEKIELQGLAFHHVFIRNIGNVNRSEIRLSCLRAEARKFRTVEFDEIIVVLMLVLYLLEKARVIVIGILRVFISKLVELV